jgi:uncharacterized glyoxalase superfamily protein PhnB
MSSGTRPHPLVPYLIVDGCAAALDFYARALGAIERYRLEEPNGRVAHAELELQGAPLMLADEYPEQGYLGPRRLGGSSCSLALYVADADAAVAQAVAAGATLERATRDEFYGERVGEIRDPFGYRWSLHEVRVEVSAETIKQRFAELTQAAGS